MRTLSLTGCLSLLILWLGLGLTPTPSAADQNLWGPERNVFINDELVTGQDLMLLDTLNEGFIPPGEYWINYDTGAWGYKNGPAQGIIGQQTQPQTDDNGSNDSSNDNRSYDDVMDDFCVSNPGVCP